MREPKPFKRSYALGQRNPDTLPGKYSNSESEHDNRIRTRNLRLARAWAMRVGGKYV